MKRLITTLASVVFLLAALFNSQNRPRRYLIVGIGVICMHVVYKLMWICFADEHQYEPPVPLGLIYPVLLYLVAHSYYRPAGVISNWIKGVFVLPLLFFFALLTWAALQYVGEDWAVRYAKVYYAASMVSLLVHAVLTTRLYSIYNGPSAPMDILIRQLTMLTYGLVLFTYITWYQISIPKSEIGFEARPMIFLFLAIGFAIVVRHLVVYKVGIRNDYGEVAGSFPAGNPELEDGISEPPDSSAQLLIEIIERELNHTKLFLNPAVSLDMLAQHTRIPRHQLTQVFNGYYKKSFYQFIAAARIEYAIDRLSEIGDTVTLDSLSYECGFNSKTSFNRYFKEYTGMTPSDYRSIQNESLLLQ